MKKFLSLKSVFPAFSAIILVAGFLLLFSLPKNASADSLYTQNSSTVPYTFGGVGGSYQPHLTLTSGSATKISFIRFYADCDTAGFIQVNLYDDSYNGINTGLGVTCISSNMEFYEVDVTAQQTAYTVGTGTIMYPGLYFGGGSLGGGTAPFKTLSSAGTINSTYFEMADSGGFTLDYTGGSGLIFTAPVNGSSSLSPTTFSGFFDDTVALPAGADNILVFLVPRDGSGSRVVLIPVTGGGGSTAFSQDIPLPNGIYDWGARLMDSTTVDSFGDWYPALNSYPNYFQVGVLNPNTGVFSPELQDCDTTDIGCHLQNAFTWLFGIAPGTLQQFSTLTLENSLPFSYAYDVGNLFDELYANGGSMGFDVSASTPIGNIVFISPALISAVPFASTIKTILGYMIYFFTAMTIYRMILRVHSTSHA